MTHDIFQYIILVLIILSLQVVLYMQSRFNKSVTELAKSQTELFEIIINARKSDKT
jgi:hypothetical protein